MIVRSAYTLKRCATLDEAMTYITKIQKGVGKHKESEMEIQWDPKGKPADFYIKKGLLDQLASGEKPEETDDGEWSVVVVNETGVPGGKTCAECDGTHFEPDDFLCPDCRAA
jgi:hypothetical protein